MASALQFWTLLLSSTTMISCGGPTMDSKAANAVQTLLANSAEAFLLGGGQTSVSIACSGGGSLGYAGAPSTIDPVQGRFDFDVLFNDCKILVCGDSITFATSSGPTRLSLTALEPGQATELIGGGAVVGPTDQFLEIGITATGQSVSGFLKGNLNFAYRMRLIGNKNGLKTISIVESPDGDPIKVHGRELPAENLSTLADRC